MTETDFKAWVDRLVQTCLPLDVQKKLLSSEPLTKDEALRYVNVVSLVAQAETLPKITSTDKTCTKLLELISRVEKRQIDQGKTLHTIDIHTTPPLENFEDLFKGNTEVQRNMFIAGFRLLKSKAYARPRTAATCVFDDFKRKNITGRYKNKNSFCALFARKWELLNQLPRI